MRSRCDIRSVIATGAIAVAATRGALACENAVQLVRGVESAGFSESGQYAGKTSDPPDPSAPPPKVKKIVELSSNEDELKKAFNKDQGQVRLVLILSPT